MNPALQPVCSRSVEVKLQTAPTQTESIGHR